MFKKCGRIYCVHNEKFGFPWKTYKAKIKCFLLIFAIFVSGFNSKLCQKQEYEINFCYRYAVSEIKCLLLLRLSYTKLMYY